jgi:hypothetical protein
LEFDTPEGKSEIYRESIEVSKSSVEISDETFVESIGIDQPSAVEIQLAGPTDEIFTPIPK